MRCYPTQCVLSCCTHERVWTEEESGWHFQRGVLKLLLFCLDWDEVRWCYFHFLHEQWQVHSYGELHLSLSALGVCMWHTLNTRGHKTAKNSARFLPWSCSAGAWQATMREEQSFLHKVPGMWVLVFKGQKPPHPEFHHLSLFPSFSLWR